MKCIVADDAWIYAGCDDGNVYDLSGKVPRVAYAIAPEIDIYWLDIHDGVLGVSDAERRDRRHRPRGRVPLAAARARAARRWMVRCDADARLPRPLPGA